MSSKKNKKSIIEGWLKKKKGASSFKLFTKANKRWFSLDIVNAVFTYASGKNKKANKVIPLRDIEDISTQDLDFEPNNNREPKEWEHYFKLTTKERAYHLFAQTKADKEMWVHAFNTILKYKRQATSMKGKDHEEAKGAHNSGAGSSEEDPNLRQAPESEEDEAEEDYMEDNGHHNLRSTKHPINQDDEYHQRKHKKLQDSDHEGEEDSGEDDEEEQHRPPPKAKATKNTKTVKSIEEQKGRGHQPQHEQYEEIELPRAQPLKKKRRDDPEIIEDEDLLDSDGEKHNKNEKENREVRDQPNKRKDKMQQRNDDPDDIDLDIDQIVKKGITETLKLDPPSPPKMAKPEEQTYFSDFNHMNKQRNAAALSKPQPPQKPKPVIKAKNIKRDAKSQEDLLSEWEKKYGKKTEAENGSNWSSQADPSVFHPPSQPTQHNPQTGKTRQYVENVLANQPKIKAEEFEENWDDEDYTDLTGPGSTHSYRHPDIPESDTHAKAKKKKKGKKKKQESKAPSSALPPNTENFDMNWDD